MRKEVRVVYVFIFLVIFSTMVFAVGEDIASVSLDTKGNDLECLVEYNLAVADKKASFQWINQNGIMNVPNQAILERVHFTRGDTIICKYSDFVNGISIQDKLKVINTPPELLKIEDKIITQGNILQLSPKADDVDGDLITFSYTYPLDENGRWDDTIEFGVGDYEVVLTAEDNNGGTDTQVVVITLLDRFGDQREVVDRRKQESSELLREVTQLREGRSNKQLLILKLTNLQALRLIMKTYRFRK